MRKLPSSHSRAECMFVEEVLTKIVMMGIMAENVEIETVLQVVQILVMRVLTALESFVVVSGKFTWKIKRKLQLITKK